MYSPIALVYYYAYTYCININIIHFVLRKARRKGTGDRDSGRTVCQSSTAIGRSQYSSCCHSAARWWVGHRPSLSSSSPRRLIHYPPRPQTARTRTRAMASGDNGDFDTDLSAAPAKRMRYSFADEIARSSHFEAFGQRFTGFPSGECYGKCARKNVKGRLLAGGGSSSRKHGGFFSRLYVLDVHFRRGVPPSHPPASSADVIIPSLSFPRQLRHIAAFPSSPRHNIIIYLRPLPIGDNHKPRYYTINRVAVIVLLVPSDNCRVNCIIYIILYYNCAVVRGT